MADRTPENREQLARQVVDAMDLDTLVSWAYETLEAMYELNEDHFQEDWEWMRGEDEADA